MTRFCKDVQAKEVFLICRCSRRHVASNVVNVVRGRAIHDRCSAQDPSQQKRCTVSDPTYTKEPIARMALLLVLQVAQQLRNPTAGAVLKLNHSIWLDFRGETSNELCMRRCYANLLVGIKSHRKAQQFVDDDNGTVIVTGTPGTHLLSSRSSSARGLILLPNQPKQF